jgi:hypothetical protein
MKIISFIAARHDQDLGEFRRWFLNEHAPQLIEHWPALKRYIVNLADMTPNVGTELASMFKGTFPVDNPYEVSTEMWFETAEDYTDLSRRYRLPYSCEGDREPASSPGAPYLRLSGRRSLSDLKRPPNDNIWWTLPVHKADSAIAVEHDRSTLPGVLERTRRQSAAISHRHVEICPELGSQELDAICPANPWNWRVVLAHR